MIRAMRYRDIDKQLAQFFRQLVGGRAIFRGIACLDTDGTVVAVAGDLAGGLLGPPPPRGRVRLVPDTDGGRIRLLQLEAPILDPDRPGALLGSLVAVVEPARLLRAAQGLVETVGPYTALTVHARQGEVLVDTTETAFPGGSGHRDATRDVIASSVAVKPLLAADGPELEAVVSEPAEIALAGVESLRDTLVRTSALVILLASALGALVAWWIGRPVRRLTNAVRRISETGRLETPVDLPAAGGEVGVGSRLWARLRPTSRMRSGRRSPC
jgi:hypothetical protein